MVTPTATRRWRPRCRRRATPRCRRTNIQKAIDRGTGAGADGAAIERILYEGYGPGGVAVLVEALTDNRNRASAEIRFAFSSTAAASASRARSPGSSRKRARSSSTASRYGEDDLIAAIDAGAEDVREDGEQLRVICDPRDLSAVREALEAAGVEIESATMATEPKSTVEVEGPTTPSGC